LSWLIVEHAFYKISGVALREYSTAANCHDDFNFVTIDQQVLREQAARYNLTVAFDGDAFSGEI
jgi:hypothetical protein